MAKKGESFWKKAIEEYVRDAAEEKQGKKAPKILAFKRILGFRVISRFLEVEETSPPLCNLNFASKTSYCN